MVSSQVHVGLPSPLVWDALRTWTINVTMAKPDISLLRDHITLFTDVAKDWTSGPPGSYEHFVPYVYVMNFTLSDYSLRLFVNDHNIINNPATIEDNSASEFRAFGVLELTGSLRSSHHRQRTSPRRQYLDPFRRLPHGVLRYPLPRRCASKSFLSR